MNSGGPPNLYCARLRIPVPRLEESVKRKDAKPLHLMIITLIENGGPMTVGEIAVRLRKAGYEGKGPELEKTLLRAWSKRHLLLRDKEGRLHPNFGARELDYPLFFIGPERPPLPRTKDFPLPPDSQRLTEKEVEAAFRNRTLYGKASLPIAALLDALRRPLTLDEINERLGKLSRFRGSLMDSKKSHPKRGLFERDESGRFILVENSPDLPGIRRKVREMARPTLASESHRKPGDGLTKRWEERDRREEEEARGMRRAVILSGNDLGFTPPIGVLDLSNSEFRSFDSSSLESLDEHLSGFQLLVGISLIDSLQSLGLNPIRWHLAELGPTPRKARMGKKVYPDTHRCDHRKFDGRSSS